MAGQIRTSATRAILAARKKETAELAAEEKEPVVIREFATPINDTNTAGDIVDS